MFIKSSKGVKMVLFSYYKMSLKRNAGKYVNGSWHTETRSDRFESGTWISSHLTFSQRFSFDLG